VHELDRPGYGDIKAELCLSSGHKFAIESYSYHGFQAQKYMQLIQPTKGKAVYQTKIANFINTPI
jgi:hypothetical protein